MKSSVKLLKNLPIKLNFEKHILFPISAKSQTAAKHLFYMGHKEKEAMINTFVHSNFNNCGLVFVFGTSVLKSPKIKLKKFMKEV